MRLFQLGALAATVLGDCDGDWTFDGVDTCIKVLPKKVSHSGAKTACTAAGGTLGLPKSSAWEDIIFSGISQGPLWLNLERNTDTKLFETSDYSNWYKDQPDNYKGSQNCAQLTNAGPTILGINFAPGWDDNSCSEKSYPLCEKPCFDCQVVNGCPTGWTQDDNNNCYKLYTNKKSWGEAECACQKMGAHLAYLEDGSYDKYARDHPAIWIGYRHFGEEKEFKQSDGGDMTYKNFLKGVPDNYGGIEWCIEIRDLGRDNPIKELAEFDFVDFAPVWNDNTCSDKNPYICQHKLDAGLVQNNNCTVFNGDMKATINLFSAFLLVSLFY